MSKVFNVLFLSQRNSARSVMAEAILNHFGKGRFQAFSAGVNPTADVEPIVYELLDHASSMLSFGDLSQAGRRSGFRWTWYTSARCCSRCS